MACRLVKTDHIPERARFPAVDAHNHLWSDWDRLGEIARAMDEAGVACSSDLTANLDLRMAGGGYSFRAGRIETFFERAAAAHPGRFYCFTTATFSRPFSEPLFTDARAFAEETVEMLREHVRLGARGLKILKELGLRYRDAGGNIVFADDPRLAPVWEELGAPACRCSSPVGPRRFFEPVTPENEHFDTLEIPSELGARSSRGRKRCWNTATAWSGTIRARFSCCPRPTSPGPAVSRSSTHANVHRLLRQDRRARTPALFGPRLLPAPFRPNPFRD